MPGLSPVVDASRLNRLLLVKLSSLGDIVHALPLLDALREGLGEKAFIAWAVRGKFAALLEDNPGLNALYRLEESGPGALWRFGKGLCKAQFEVTLDVQGLLISGLLTRLSGAPVRIGMDANREGNALFLTHPVVRARQRAHMTEKLFGFCDALGIPRRPVTPQRYLALGKQSEASELLSGAPGEPRVGCIVGASTADKTYPAAQWAQVVRLLSDAGVNVVLLGGEKEMGVASEIARQSGIERHNLAGKTPLRVLASVLAQCDVILGGDSGPTHLATAVGTPVVGLYGVTDPARTGPQWGAAPTVTLDYAEKDAPPEMRRPRHSGRTDALSRIPANAIAQATMELLRSTSVQEAS